jgi:hypothetical protein
MVLLTAVAHHGNAPFICAPSSRRARIPVIAWDTGGNGAALAARCEWPGVQRLGNRVPDDLGRHPHHRDSLAPGRCPGLRELQGLRPAAISPRKLVPPEAAGIDMARVTIYTLHQHTAPTVDFDA